MRKSDGTQLESNESCFTVKYLKQSKTNTSEYEYVDKPTAIGTYYLVATGNPAKGYFGTTEYIFEFTHMTSAQFISKVEDLCNYDMIYMGLYTDTMNTNSGTKRTVYNDSNMNGLVYTNIGDRQYDGFAAGAMDNDYYRAATKRETDRILPR